MGPEVVCCAGGVVGGALPVGASPVLCRLRSMERHLGALSDLFVAMALWLRNPSRVGGNLKTYLKSEDDSYIISVSSRLLQQTA